jgi:hypothetical protein
MEARELRSIVVEANIQRYDGHTKYVHAAGSQSYLVHETPATHVWSSNLM